MLLPLLSWLNETGDRQAAIQESDIPTPILPLSAMDVYIAKQRHCIRPVSECREECEKILTPLVLSMCTVRASGVGRSQ